MATGKTLEQLPSATLPLAGSELIYVVQGGAPKSAPANAAGSGTVTGVAVATANGFAGTVATPGTTPSISIETTVTGLLEGDGTGVAAATVTGTGSVVLANSPGLAGTPTAPTASAGTNSTQLASTAFVLANRGGISGYNPQTGTSYTFALSDDGWLVSGNNASAQTFTVPTNASVPFPVGAVVNLIQLGAGVLSLVGAAGVTIDALAGANKMAGQYAAATLVQVQTDVWVLFGGVST